MSDRYAEFLKAKVKLAPTHGFEVEERDTNPAGKPHCRVIVPWLLLTVAVYGMILVGGFVVSVDGVTVYFAGDTGYTPQFAAIGARAPSIDVALLPIGAYEPRWFMEPMHMNPEEAVRAHRDIKTRLSIGMHFGTFQLTDEPIEAPYLVTGASFVGCHQFGLLSTIDVLGRAADGATLLLDCPDPPEEVWDALPLTVQKQPASTPRSAATVKSAAASISTARTPRAAQRSYWPSFGL